MLIRNRRFLGQNRQPVGNHFGKATRHVKDVLLGIRFDAKSSIPESAQQRRAVEQDTDLAVVGRQRDKRRVALEYRPFWGDNSAAEGLFAGHAYLLSVGLSLALQLCGPLLGILDRADIHEGLIGQMVPLALAQLLERLDGVLPGYVDARNIGELLGGEECL